MNIDIEQAAINATIFARQLSSVATKLVWSSCPRDIRTQLEKDNGYAFFCNQFFAYLTSDTNDHTLKMRQHALSTSLMEYTAPLKGRTMYNWGKSWDAVYEGLLIEKSHRICEDLNALIQNGALPLPQFEPSKAQLKRRRQSETRFGKTKMTINGVEVMGKDVERELAKLEKMLDGTLEKMEQNTQKQNDAFSDIMKNHMKRFGK